MIVFSVYILLVTLPLIKYGIYTMECCYNQRLIYSYNVLMYHGVPVEQCLLLRILCYKA